MNFNDNPWEPTLNAACQCSHFFVGATLVAFCVAVGWGYLCGLGIVLGWSATKEWVWDLRVELDNPGWSGSLQDFFYYNLGGGLCAGLLWVVKWWGAS